MQHYSDMQDLSTIKEREEDIRSGFTQSQEEKKPGRPEFIDSNLRERSRQRRERQTSDQGREQSRSKSPGIMVGQNFKMNQSNPDLRNVNNMAPGYPQIYPSAS